MLDKSKIITSVSNAVHLDSIGVTAGTSVMTSRFLPKETVNAAQIERAELQTREEVWDFLYAEVREEMFQLKNLAYHKGSLSIAKAIEKIIQKLEFNNGQDK